MCKVSSRWVPRLLATEHKKKWMGSALNFLLHYEKVGPSLLDRIITGDKNWALRKYSWNKTIFIWMERITLRITDTLYFVKGSSMFTGW